MNGGGGIRTLVWFPTHRFRGGPVRPSPAPLLPILWFGTKRVFPGRAIRPGARMLLRSLRDPRSPRRGSHVTFSRTFRRLGSNLLPHRSSDQRPDASPVAARSSKTSARVETAFLDRIGASARTSGSHPGDQLFRPASRAIHRGARIRTGDLCDPNAALYRTEPRPVPSSALDIHFSATTCRPSSGRGGIRTHVGFRPHDFQSCALSRSATRPDSRLPGNGGSWNQPAKRGPRMAHRATAGQPTADGVPQGPPAWVRIPPNHLQTLDHNGGSGIRTHADRSPTP